MTFQETLLADPNKYISDMNWDARVPAWMLWLDDNLNDVRDYNQILKGDSNDLHSKQALDDLYEDIPIGLDKLRNSGANFKVTAKSENWYQPINYIDFLKSRYDELIDMELVNDRVINLFEQINQEIAKGLHQKKKMLGKSTEFREHVAKTLLKPGGLKERAMRATNTNFRTNVDLKEGLCKELGNEMYKEELLTLAKEMRLPYTKATTKRELCEMIANYSLHTL